MGRLIKIEEVLSAVSVWFCSVSDDNKSSIGSWAGEAGKVGTDGTERIEDVTSGRRDDSVPLIVEKSLGAGNIVEGCEGASSVASVDVSKTGVFESFGSESTVKDSGDVLRSAVVFCSDAVTIVATDGASDNEGDASATFSDVEALVKMLSAADESIAEVTKASGTEDIEDIAVIVVASPNGLPRSRSVTETEDGTVDSVMVDGRTSELVRPAGNIRDSTSTGWTVGCI